MHITQGELERRFDFHPAQTVDKADKHQKVRSVCQDAAKEILEITGESSREQSLAITALEEAMFWANAALARPASSA